MHLFEEFGIDLNLAVTQPAFMLHVVAVGFTLRLRCLYSRRYRRLTFSPLLKAPAIRAPAKPAMIAPQATTS